MNHRWIAPGLVVLALVAAPALAPAQTTTPTTPPTFSQLSPGEQKIVTALYDAQTGTTKLTTDQIAALKTKGTGWGEVFKAMKSQGLVDAKNLGEVVSNYERQHHDVAGDHTTASGPKDHVGGMSDHTQTGEFSRGGFGHGGGRVR